ncbi:hypothetical protein CTI12_AA449250 [Artemisia annua]|uniref:COI1 F-box domain-containing protein n=1 Tax=Artemisia annua TaxID=35608 RepID=A0A2U1LV86_ARTAN|nr:hypothetical protein CTI12_AA449250 [Artemisia annua]
MEEHPHESIDTVFNCVIPYIQNGDDRNSISLVCRRWYEIDCMTRKHVTVHVVYSRHLPSRVAQRFPYLESLTLKGFPRVFRNKLQYVDLRPWIKEIVVSFKCLNSLDIRRVIVRDLDLEKLARSRGKDLRVLKINDCKGSRGNRYIHIGRYCYNLRTLCLVDNKKNQKNRKWLHELALNNTCIESFQFSSTISEYDVKDLTLLAKSCSQSLVCLKMGKCCLSDLRGVFSHAVNLKDFACCELEIFEQEGDQCAGLKFPPNMRISIYSCIDESVLPFLLPLSNQLRELNLRVYLNQDSLCFLIRRCPNLEVLYINHISGDNVLQVIGESCKKLHKLKTDGLAATHMGLIALAQGCLELECLHINFRKYTTIPNEFLVCIGSHLKNLNDFQITLHYSTIVDSGIRAMLIGCNKLERLRINYPHSGKLTDASLGYIGMHGHNLRYLSLSYINSSDAGLVDSGIRAMMIGCSKLERLRLNDFCGDLTNVGLGYIGKYGHNLRHLSLGGYISDFKEGLVELSKGCPRLRKLEIHKLSFSKQALSTLMFNLQSLRYMWVLDQGGPVGTLFWQRRRAFRCCCNLHLAAVIGPHTSIPWFWRSGYNFVPNAKATENTGLPVFFSLICWYSDRKSMNCRPRS